MTIGFLNYIFVMLTAGAASFGGGIGGANIMKEFALGWITNPETTGIYLKEMLHITAVSQYSGYAQGIMLANYLGMKTDLGILGGIIGSLAFILPSVIIAAVIIKIGGKLYKNGVFKYSVKYINLFAAGLICMIVWNYTITILDADMIVYPLAAGFACFLSIYFNVNPIFILLGGAVIGAVWI